MPLGRRVAEPLGGGGNVQGGMLSARALRQLLGAHQQPHRALALLRRAQKDPKGFQRL